MAEKEYIEREAMIQRLKNTPLFSNFNTGGIFLRDGVIDLVEKQPAADVVEVVRCKDCRFKTLTQDGEYNPEDIVCEFFMTDGMQENDFCSYGERKEE